MTRNDFEILARHLKAMYPAGKVEYNESDYRDGYSAAINQVAGACGSVSSRFDIDKFKKACGMVKAPNMPPKGAPINW